MEQELKQIYDMHPSLKVIFTGSSVLDIKRGEADLSRRALMYMMQGLSFREYLQLFHGIKSRVFSFEEILNHQVEIPEVEHPLPLFREYLTTAIIHLPSRATLCRECCRWWTKPSR